MTAPPSLFDELRRRSVFKVTGVYVVVAFAILQGVDLAVEPLRLPSWTMTLLWILLLAGFPVAVVLAWAYDLTPEGVQRTRPHAARTRRRPAEPRHTPRPSPRGVGLRPRPMRAVAFVAGVAVLALAGWGALTLRRDSSERLDPRRVVVAVFENQTGEAEYGPLGRMAADYITQGLAGIGYIQVIDARTIPGVWSDSASNPALVRTLAAGSRAGTLVRGSYYLDGDSIHLNAQITDAGDGHLLRSVAPVAASRTAPVRGVEQLANGVMAALALTLDPRRAAWGESGSRAKAPSYEAYRAYSAGLDAYNRGELLAAAPEFERAVALDSTFHAARIWAALSRLLIPWANLAPRGEYAHHLALADSIAREVQRRRDRLEPYDRHFFDWYLANRRDDHAAAYNAASRMLESAPGSVVALKELAWAARRDDRPREAIELYERLGLERGLLRDDREYWRGLSSAAHRVGDYRRELRYARTAQQLFPELFPERQGFIVREARALAALGQVEEAERLRDQQGEILQGATLYDIALELRAHGHEAASRRTLERALEFVRSLPGAEQEHPSQRLLVANVLFSLGREAEARPIYERLTNEDPDPAWQAQGRLGVIAAHAGDPETARQIYAGLLADTILLAQRDANLPLARAAVAAALGDRSAAVMHARQVSGGVRWEMLHVRPEMESLRGYAPFERLMRPKT
jgi:tetratricopeptide (TPR) repeat protein